MREIPEDRQWKTQTGAVMAIDDMEDNHLLNSIRMIERNVPHYKEKLVSEAYTTLSMMQGEQAQWDIERDIDRLEEQDPRVSLSEIFPVYDNMKKLAKKRGLKL